MAMTLVRRCVYFGMEPRSLRDAANRVLARVPEDTTVPAIVAYDALVEDLAMGSGAGRVAIDKMVRDGYLECPNPGSNAYRVTDRFRAIALARIVEPLPRARAQDLVAKCKQLARHFNRTATSNRYEIEALAVFGNYMSTLEELPELALGIAGRRRPPAERPRLGRATVQREGTAQLRALFEAQSSFIEVTLFRSVQDAPRPFSVIFKADD